MGKRWSGVIPADEDRCTRNDGKSWRCYAPRLARAIYCEKHQLAYLAKCSSSSSSSNYHHHNQSPPPKIKKTPKTSVSRVPKSRVFEPNQIWASSSSSSQHPFLYCRIACRNPSDSSIHVTPLIPHPILEEEIKWVDNGGGGGRSIACGTFRPSPKKHIMEVDASTLSFKVVGIKIVHWMGIPFYRIFPNKGEIWRVGSKDGNGDPKLVEVLTEFSEEEGVTVAGLVPVEGSGGGVYERGSYDGFRLVQTYGRREMVVFEKRALAEKVEGNGDGDQHLWKVSQINHDPASSKSQHINFTVSPYTGTPPVTFL